MKRLAFIIFSLAVLLFPITVAFSQSIYSEISCDCIYNPNNDSLFFNKLELKDYSDSISHYEYLYGENKIIPSEIKELVLVALSFFPEFAETNIVFEYKSIKQTMNARPFVSNIFKRKTNRKYKIIINDNQGKHKGLPIEKLSFNIVVGWLAHELAHIVVYEKMTNPQIISFAVKYLTSNRYNRMVERCTDFLTIKHGLAYPLYDGVEYLLNDDTISEDYKNKIRENYLTLDEIKCFWQQIFIDSLEVKPANNKAE